MLKRKNHSLFGYKRWKKSVNLCVNFIGLIDAGNPELLKKDI